MSWIEWFLVFQNLVIWFVYLHAKRWEAIALKILDDAKAMSNVCDEYETLLIGMVDESCPHCEDEAETVEGWLQ